MSRLLVSVIMCAAISCRPAAQDERNTTGAAPPTTGFLVLQKLSSSVAFYSPAGDLLETVPVGLNPHEMIVSLDGHTAYVSDYGALGVEQEAPGGTTITVIDIPSRTKTGVIELAGPRRPHGLDLDSGTGRLLVTTENPNRLLLIDPTAREVVAVYDTQGRSSHMVTVSPDGKRAFVSNIATRDVSIIDLTTGDVALVPVGERPEGSDISSDGSALYVACRESNVISIIDTEHDSVVGEVATGRGPNRVRLTPDEKLLVYSLVHDSQIGIADVAAREQIATIDLAGAPVSLQMSRDGTRILTASQDSDEVYVVSLAERRILTRFKTARGAGPDPVLETYVPYLEKDR